MELGDESWIGTVDRILSARCEGIGLGELLYTSAYQKVWLV